VAISVGVNLPDGMILRKKIASVESRENKVISSRYFVVSIMAEKEMGT
jgi:hypothetical protein